MSDIILVGDRSVTAPDWFVEHYEVMRAALASLQAAQYCDLCGGRGEIAEDDGSGTGQRERVPCDCKGQTWEQQARRLYAEKATLQAENKRLAERVGWFEKAGGVTMATRIFEVMGQLERFQAAHQRLRDAAEMLWIVIANVSGGDWLKQSEEWKTAAARWRDAYFEAFRAEAAQQENG